MRHPLTDHHTDGRLRLLALAEELTEADGSIRTTACPAWSVKDVYAHLAGISTDILSGNTAEAATEAWADGQVTDRREKTLAEVVEEWRTAGAEVSGLMEQMGQAFPLELFVDQWTHEWDVRSALGPRAAAQPDNSIYEHYFDEFGAIIGADAGGLGTLTVEVNGRSFSIGDGEPVGTLALSMFEFARITMGRRSIAQLEKLRWPVDDYEPYLSHLVRWSVADRDVVDPAR